MSVKKECNADLQEEEFKRLKKTLLYLSRRELGVSLMDWCERREVENASLSVKCVVQ